MQELIILVLRLTMVLPSAGFNTFAQLVIDNETIMGVESGGKCDTLTSINL